MTPANNPPAQGAPLSDLVHRGPAAQTEFPPPARDYDSLPVDFGIRNDGSAWLEMGNPNSGPHAAGDVNLPPWALASIKRRCNAAQPPPADAGKVVEELANRLLKSDSQQFVPLITATLAPLTARLAEVERERDEAKRPWTVQLYLPSSAGPFDNVECRLIDTGHADRVLVVASDEVNKLESDLTKLRGELEATTKNLADADATISEWHTTANEQMRVIAALRTQLTQAQSALAQKEKDGEGWAKHAADLYEVAICLKKHAVEAKEMYGVDGSAIVEWAQEVFNRVNAARSNGEGRT